MQAYAGQTTWAKVPASKLQLLIKHEVLCKDIHHCTEQYRMLKGIFQLLDAYLKKKKN